MSLIVKFNKSWFYNEDADGNVRRNIPPHWLGELPDDVAAAAIFEGAAEAVHGITPDVQHYLDQFAQIKPGMTDEEIAALLTPPPAADGDGGETVDPETGEITDKPAGKKSRKAAG